LTDPSDSTKKENYRRNPTILEEKVTQLKEWLLAHPSHWHVSFRYLPSYTPDLGLQGYRFEAIWTAFKSIGYSRQVAKRKGSSDNLAVIRQRVAFAQEGLTWTQERLYRQAFSDEV
jgi:hypothetical protein